MTIRVGLIQGAALGVQFLRLTAENPGGGLAGPYPGLLIELVILRIVVLWGIKGEN